MESTPSPALTLSSEDIERARRLLEQVQNEVIGALKGVTEEQARFRPAPDAWSIAENLEHIVSVQERIFGVLRDRMPQAPAGPEDRDISRIDDLVMYRYPARMEKGSAPESLRPKGDVAVKDGIGQLSANTRLYVEYLESSPDLRGHVLESPPLKSISKGEHTHIDGYQLILFSAAHTQRHVKQILEVKADPGFPER